MRYTSFIMFMCLFLASCQKVAIEEGKEPAAEGQAVVTFNIDKLESFEAARSADIASFCNRINVVAYKNGLRVKQINQSAGDDDFGNITMALDTGSYSMVILAHSFHSNPALTNPQKITFGHDLGDTFLWTGECRFTSDKVVPVSMQRVVGLFRLVTTDSIPSNVASVRFYYTGGSSSLDATTRLGCVASRQTSTFTVTEDMKSRTATFDAYSFPKSEDGSLLNISVTAHDKNNDVIVTKQFTNIPVRRNQISLYRGKLFSGGDVVGEGNANIHLTADDEWKTVEYDF